jgi:hypothetical protein
MKPALLLPAHLQLGQKHEEVDRGFGVWRRGRRCGRAAAAAASHCRGHRCARRHGVPGRCCRCGDGLRPGREAEGEGCRPSAARRQAAASIGCARRGGMRLRLRTRSAEVASSLLHSLCGNGLVLGRQRWPAAYLEDRFADQKMHSS